MSSSDGLVDTESPAFDGYFDEQSDAKSTHGCLSPPWIATLLLVTSGTALFGSTVYALVSSKLSILSFAWVDPWVDSATIMGVMAGLCTAMLGLFTCANRSLGGVIDFDRRMVKMLVVCASLAAFSAIGAHEVTHGFQERHSSHAETLARGWLSAKNQTSPGGQPVTCVVQTRFHCVGAWTGDCRNGAHVERCDDRCFNKGNERGCFIPIGEVYIKWYTPQLITSWLAVAFCCCTYCLLRFKVG